jgi:hypothetical protein
LLPATVSVVLACRLFGHRPHFAADGPVMRWSCERGCGHAGEKRYASAEEAARYAQAFDRRETETLGRRAPYFGLFPLRIWHWARRRRAQQQAADGRASGGAPPANDERGP